ncbi:hypothetical protein GPK63_10580 [Faecalibacterium prausnitzii]|jgi:hypothetical protein|uniref:hypothetical protein n=1 Tax=Faecalibacterium prausnitzii TaxID=853 RepID=UPI001C022305|nr:hypothetical protein [Faecalibacterium prausnitzii]MBT9713203.1 hypothetical protein [Faecalibacterium prausnitzii]
MKAVLLSIRPEWCDLIIRGQKTIADAICDMDDEELAKRLIPIVVNQMCEGTMYTRKKRR